MKLNECLGHCFLGRALAWCRNQTRKKKNKQRTSVGFQIDERTALVRPSPVLFSRRRVPAGRLTARLRPTLGRGLPSATAPASLSDPALSAVQLEAASLPAQTLAPLESHYLKGGTAPQAHLPGRSSARRLLRPRSRSAAGIALPIPGRGIFLFEEVITGLQIRRCRFSFPFSKQRCQFAVLNFDLLLLQLLFYLIASQQSCSS